MTEFTIDLNDHTAQRLIEQMGGKPAAEQFLTIQAEQAANQAHMEQVQQQAQQQAQEQSRQRVADIAADAADGDGTDAAGADD